MAETTKASSPSSLEIIQGFLAPIETEGLHAAVPLAETLLDGLITRIPGLSIFSAFGHLLVEGAATWAENQISPAAAAAASHHVIMKRNLPAK